MCIDLVSGPGPELLPAIHWSVSSPPDASPGLPRQDLTLTVTRSADGVLIATGGRVHETGTESITVPVPGRIPRRRADYGMDAC